MMLTIKDPRVFRALVEGKKRYEGRSFKEEYLSLEGKIVLFVLEGSHYILLSRVERVIEFSSVREMVSSLWKELIPWATSPDDALSVYKQFYSPEERAIAIKVDPILLVSPDLRTLRKWLWVDLPKTLKVALPVEGDSLFLGHFGDAPFFEVYECSLDGCVLLEVRKNTSEEEEHEEHHGDPKKFKQILSLLGDVHVWAAFRMGPNYVRIIRETNVVPFLLGVKDKSEALRRIRESFLGLSLRVVCRWK